MVELIIHTDWQLVTPLVLGMCVSERWGWRVVNMCRLTIGQLKRDKYEQ